MTLESGTRLGHYRIIELLAAGAWQTCTALRMSASDARSR